jgi:hypothetical protein
MAKFRQFHMSFWTDPKIEEFTAEEKYLYMFLLTTPLTNLCGCYEISYKKIEDFTGIKKDKAEKLVSALQSKGVIDYSKETYELLVINWHKYNWTSSNLFRKPLQAEIENVKNSKFKEYLTDLFNGQQNEYRIDTVSENTDTVSEDKPKKAEKPEKWAYGEYKNVMLTDDEYNKLLSKYGQELTDAAINKLDTYLLEPKNKNKYKSHYAAMLNWVFKAVDEDRIRQGRQTTARTQPTDINDYLMNRATGGMV